MTQMSARSTKLAQGASLSASGLMIAGGIYNIITINIIFLPVAIYLILAGCFCMMGDLRAFKYFGYFGCFYTPFRGLIYAFFGTCLLGAGLVNIILGCFIIFFGISFFMTCSVLKFVPRPILQRDVEAHIFDPVITFG